MSDDLAAAVKDEKDLPISERIAMLERRIARLEDYLLPDDLTDPETQHRLVIASRSSRRGGARRRQ